MRCTALVFTGAALAAVPAIAQNEGGQAVFGVVGTWGLGDAVDEHWLVVNDSRQRYAVTPGLLFRGVWRRAETPTSTVSPDQPPSVPADDVAQPGSESEPPAGVGVDGGRFWPGFLGLTPLVGLGLTVWRMLTKHRRREAFVKELREAAEQALDQATPERLEKVLKEFVSTLTGWMIRVAAASLFVVWLMLVAFAWFLLGALRS